MAIKDDVRSRIYEAAEKLHAESPDGSLPTVDAVRQLSQANMNSVVEAMKDWRAKQRKQVQVIKEPLPAELLSQVHAAGQSLWETAQFMANEALSAARNAFEAEKSGLLQLSQEQSASFERVSAELNSAEERVAELGLQALEKDEAYRLLEAKGNELVLALSQAQQETVIALQKAAEVERRADELRVELDRAHDDARFLRDAAGLSLSRAETAEGRADAAREVLESANKAIAQLREDLATEKGMANVSAENAKRSAALLVRAEADQGEARSVAAAARENAAALRGELAATRGEIERLQAVQVLEKKVANEPVVKAAARVARRVAKPSTKPKNSN